MTRSLLFAALAGLALLAAATLPARAQAPQAIAKITIQPVQDAAGNIVKVRIVQFTADSNGTLLGYTVSEFSPPSGQASFPAGVLSELQTALNANPNLNTLPPTFAFDNTKTVTETCTKTASGYTVALNGEVVLRNGSAAAAVQELNRSYPQFATEWRSFATSLTIEPTPGAVSVPTPASLPTVVLKPISAF